MDDIFQIRRKMYIDRNILIRLLYRKSLFMHLYEMSGINLLAARIGQFEQFRTRQYQFK